MPSANEIRRYIHMHIHVRAHIDASIYITHTHIYINMHICFRHPSKASLKTRAIAFCLCSKPFIGASRSALALSKAALVTDAANALVMTCADHGVRRVAGPQWTLPGAAPGECLNFWPYLAGIKSETCDKA